MHSKTFLHHPMHNIVLKEDDVLAAVDAGVIESVAANHEGSNEGQGGEDKDNIGTAGHSIRTNSSVNFRPCRVGSGARVFAIDLNITNFGIHHTDLVLVAFVPGSVDRRCASMRDDVTEGISNGSAQLFSLPFKVLLDG